jgi:hypothetical protein
MERLDFGRVAVGCFACDGENVAVGDAGRRAVGKPVLGEQRP